MKIVLILLVLLQSLFAYSANCNVEFFNSNKKTNFDI